MNSQSLREIFPVGFLLYPPLSPLPQEGGEGNEVFSFEKEGSIIPIKTLQASPLPSPREGDLGHSRQAKCSKQLIVSVL